jgi:hypothetical protein
MNDMFGVGHRIPPLQTRPDVDIVQLRSFVLEGTVALVAPREPLPHSALGDCLQYARFQNVQLSVFALQMRPPRLTGLEIWHLTQLCDRWRATLADSPRH